MHFKKHFKKHVIHFNFSYFYLDPTCSTLIPGSIPTLHFPEKSYIIHIPKERDSAKCIADKRAYIEIIQPSLPLPYYNSFNELCKQVKLLNLLPNWELIIKSDELVTLDKVMPIFIVPEYEIFIDPLLSFTVKCFVWSLPDNHPVYVEHNKSLNNITVSNLISLLNNYKLCAGVKMFASGIIPHVIQKVYDVNEIIKSPIQQKIFHRSSNCNLLLLGDNICCNCNAVQNYENKN